MVRSVPHLPRFTAFQTFGTPGKLAVEVCMILFVMGTCIAFFVVMGDLAPPIIANLAGMESSEELRLVILVGERDWKRFLRIFLSCQRSVFFQDSVSLWPFP